MVRRYAVAAAIGLLLPVLGDLEGARAAEPHFAAGPDSVLHRHDLSEKDPGPRSRSSRLTPHDLADSVPLPSRLAHGRVDSFTFTVYGDNRLSRSRNDRRHHSDRRSRRRAVTSAIASGSPDFVIHTGDLVEHGGDRDRWRIFREDTAPLLRSRFLYPVAGNHEYKGGLPSVYQELFGKSIGTARSYAFRVGNAAFIFLDSAAKPHPGASDSLNFHAAWLRDRLEEARDCPFLFVVFHHPAMSTGYDRVTRFLFARHAGHAPRDREERLRDILTRELERRRDRIPGARTVAFSGHSHFYERYAYDGVDFVVTGGGGAPSHMPARNPVPDRVSAYRGDHFVAVRVAGEDVDITLQPVGRGEWIQKDDGESVPHR